jgi:hypothetical protein
MLNKMNDPMILVEVDEVERDQHPQGVDSARRHNPYSLIGL